jgi:hypothetical protein
LVASGQAGRELEKRVFVGNAGKSGHLTVHLDYLLNHYALAKYFEWAIVMVALNDLGTLVARHNYEHRVQNVAEESLTPAYTNQVHYRRLALVQLTSVALRRVWRGHAISGSKMIATMVADFFIRKLRANAF